MITLNLTAYNQFSFSNQAIYPDLIMGLDKELS